MTSGAIQRGGGILDPRLEAELNRLVYAGQAEAGKVQEWRRSLGRTPPQIVYHYTTAAGLQGILASGEIWLTDIFAMNDPSELVWGVFHAIKAAEARAAGGSSEVQLMGQILSLLPTHGLGLLRAKFASASLSTANDDLGQWRAYGGNGKGYAIGFHTGMLREAFTRSLPPPKPGQYALGACYMIGYDDQVLLQRQTALVNLFFDALEFPKRQGISLPEDHYFYAKLNELLAVGTLEIALAFKHTAYEHESECRFGLVSMGFDVPPNSFTRQMAGRDVLCTKFNWRQMHPNAIAGIVMGPAAGPSEYQALREALRLCNQSSVPISKSRIPYRPS